MIETDLPSGVALKAEENPLDQGGCEEECATHLDESVHGARKEERRKALREVKAANKDYEDARVEEERVLLDNTSTNEQKRAAVNGRIEALKKFNEVHPA